MVGTRRKAKASDAQDSPAPPDNVVHVDLDPEDVDPEILSALLPHTDIVSVTADTVIMLYRTLVSQASEVDNMQKELDEARAEMERKDIELDQALQDRESAAKDLESSVESIQGDLRRISEERDELVKTNASLQEQIKTLSNSQSTSSVEVDSLKSRVVETEREKRDLVNVISRLKQESGQQDDEIKNLRTNLKEARQEHQALEATVRELRSAETSTKFKLETITQQLELAQSEVERTNAELAAKSEEFAKYRRERHTEIVTLQASFDSLSQESASAQVTLKTLQSSHSSQAHQLTQALARIQDLTGQLAEQEATYATEASTLRRLVQVMEDRERQAKSIVENIEQQWDEVNEKSKQREAELKEETEKEKSGRQAAEKRLEELETVLERMNRGELPIVVGPPGTPIRMPAPSDPLTQSMMGLSPTVAMASKAQRTGKTFTEVYADYVRLQDDYAKKSAEYDQMDRTLSAVLSQIEERAPILSQQRAEYERLQSEASQLASQLADALTERDATSTHAQETAQKLVKSTKENELLQKQLDDLGRQVQTLLKELARRDDPLIPSDEELASMPSEPAINIEAVITNNLVLFRSVGELQSQNQKLLHVVRELGEKLESEERDYKEKMQTEQQEAVAEAHEAIKDILARMESQKKHSEAVIQAYVKERDTLKIMLAKAESRAKGVNGLVNGESASTHEPSIASNDPDVAKELIEVQAQFDTYRTEMGLDSVRLREEIVEAQRESGRLGSELAKAQAKIEYMTERQRMSQEQFAIHDRELDSLTKRNQQLYDQWTRLDIECARAMEDLQIAQGNVEQLRTECANLRAEKKIWESIQSRLLDENKTLAMERSHLSDLMANVQKMHNDLERSGENDRRRLESQVQLLESQSQDLRTQISQERDNVRHITLQKDLELKELHTRLDRSNLELSKTRESLVGAETSKKHLEERVADLSKNLQGTEEKLAVYEHRPGTVNSVAPSVDPSLSREQQLQAEVAELRSALKVAEVDLANARAHVQQFQEISQASEAALESLNNTFDEFKASTDSQIAKHESERASLEEKLKATLDDVTQLRSTLAETQKTLETERTAWLNDKKILEDTIVDMSTSEKNSESDRSSRENELKQQEERAKAAEARYSSEVLAHADSIKTIENLRRDLSAAQTTSRENATAAETAKANLKSSEASWKQQKESLDKEIADLKSRSQDLVSQNSILHQHLESVSSQAARIRQAADSSEQASGETEVGGDTDAKLSELRSVVAYLRKEKEIVDLQLELSKQENSRLKAQAEHLSQTLEETRKTLADERERALEASASASQHAELVERINQLNILRESNATLRADCEAHAKRSRDLEAKLQLLSSELDPAKEQARTVQAQLEASEAHVKRLEEESARWKARNSQLLSKYDRIDPAEVQSLKDEIEQLKAAKAQLEEAAAEHESIVKGHIDRNAEIENTLRQAKERLKATIEGAKTRLGAMNAEKSTLQQKVVALEADKAALQTSLNEQTATTANSASQTALIAELRAEKDKLKEALDAATTAAAASATAAPAVANSITDEEKAELIKARDEALAKVDALAKQLQTLQDELDGVRRSHDKFKARLLEVQKARAADAEKVQAQQDTAVATAVQKAKEEMQAPAGTDSEQATKELTEKHIAELKALEERLQAEHQQALKAALDAAAAAAAASQPSSEASSADAIAAAVAEKEKELTAKRAEEIAEAVERGRMEQSAKTKLKDQALVRAQKRIKDLEVMILGWKQAGQLAENTPTTPVVPPASSPNLASTSSTKAESPSVPAKALAKPAPPAASTSTAPQNGLPRKPSTAASQPPAAGTAPAAPAGTAPTARGRGGPPGARGRVAPTHRGRGGIRTAVANVNAHISPPAAAAPAPSGSLQIHGVAGKRPREDGEVSGDDSLAKRIKPGPQAAEGGGKPIAIRRPPVASATTSPIPPTAASPAASAKSSPKP